MELGGIVRGRVAAAAAAAFGLGLTGLMTVVPAAPASAATQSHAAAGPALTWGVKASYPAVPGVSDISCPTTSTCYAVGADSSGTPDMYSTVDAGQTWTYQTLPSGVGSFVFGEGAAISCPSTSTCYVAGNSTVAVTTDGGQTWTIDSLPSGESFEYGVSCPTTTTCYVLAQNGTTFGTDLVQTADGGQTWTANALPLSSGFVLPSESTFYAPFACPTVGDCLVAGDALQTDNTTEGAIAQTSDGGSNWTFTTTSNGGQPLGSGAFFGIVCPSSSDCYASGDGFSSAFAAVTTDGGGSWNTITDPSGFINTCPTTTTCYASGFSGIQKSSDGGMTWAAVAAPEGFTGVSPLTCPSASDCYSAAIDPGQYELMAATTDGAQTWQIQTTRRGLFGFSAVSCGSSRDCYALSSAPVVGTPGFFFINGGGSAGQPIFSYAFYASSDGGGTWTLMNLPTNSISFAGGLDCPAAGVCHLSADPSEFANGSVFSTTDGGSTWTQGSLPSGDGLTGPLSCPSTNDCYAAALDSSNSPVVVASTDGGATWINKSVPSGIDELSGLDCPSTSACFVSAALANTFTPLMIATTDGGSTWSEQAVPSDTSSVDAIACPSVTTCYVAGEDTDPSTTASFGAMLLTTNGGSTWSDAWSQQTVPPVIGAAQPSDVACSSTTACVAVAFDAAIATSDGGATWTPPALPSSPGETSAVTCPTGSECLIAGEGTGDVGALVQAGTLPPAITTSSLPSGTFGSSYNTPIVASGGTTPYGWSVQSGVLPAGLTLDPSTGVISGTPTAPGTYPFTVEVTDANSQTSSSPLSISVATAASSVTATATPTSVHTGSPVTYAASVTGNGGTPSGSVHFSVGSTSLCSAALSAGSASCSAANAPVGSDTVTASYGGDADFAPSSGTAALAVDVPAPAPPAGATSSQSCATTSAQGVCLATNDGTTAQATGAGSITVSQYQSDPVGAPTFGSAAEYVDVHVGSGSTFASLSLRVCNLGGGNTLHWWNPAANGGSGGWLAVAGHPGPTLASGCLNVTLDGSTTPNLAQLIGSVFAVGVPPVPAANDCSFKSPTVGVASVQINGSDGYFVADSAGQVCARGAASWHKDLAGDRLNAPIIAVVATPDGGGYWLLGADGGVFTFGDAHFFGSTGGIRLNAPVVGMAVTPDNRGYWIVAKDGGVFSYGDARFHGSTGNIKLAQPVDGIAVAPGGNGYWLVASDGGVFTFTRDGFYGSLGNVRLAKSIVGMSSTPNGKGYTLVGSDGGVFSFGNAPFYGSLGGKPPASPIVDLSPAPLDNGYYLVTASGTVFAFGPGAQFVGNG